MSAYKTLKGQSIRQVAQDPTNPQLGEIWYNTTIGALKGYQSIGGAWASGNNANNNVEGPGSFGNKSSLVAVGGYAPGGHTNAVEEYDGTNWTTATNYPSTIYSGQGCGVITAGLVAGGNQSGATYLSAAHKYDGTNWTSANSISTARTGTSSSVGTQTAGIIFGGYAGSPLTAQNATEEFDGTNWSNGGTLSTARAYGGSGGTQTAALYFCGESINTGPIPSRIPNTSEEYNGSSWTAGGTVPARFTRLNGGGTQDACFRIGGSTGSAAVATCDLYNGTSWASAPSLGSAQNWGNSGGTGSSSAIIGKGRGSSGYTLVTQLYTDPTFGVKTLTTST